MDPAILKEASEAAYKTWGAFAFVLALLILGGWMLWSALRAERKKNEILQAKIDALQEKRLDDARQMTRVTENATLTAAARAQGDTQFLDAIRRLGEGMFDLNDRMASIEALVPPALSLPPPSPRAPRHRGAPR